MMDKDSNINIVEQEQKEEEINTNKNVVDKSPSNLEPSKIEIDKLNKEEKKKRNRRILFSILFIIANVIAIAVLVLLEDKNSNKIDFFNAMNLLGENVWWTILAFSMFFIIILTDIFVFAILIKKINGKTKNILPISIKTSFLGRYYEKITPWSIGGEPYQIFYLTYNGIKGSNTMSITSLRHIFRFFTDAIAILLILAISFISTNVYVMIGAIFGILGGLIVPLFLLICALKPKLGEKLINVIIAIGAKIKLVKDKDAAKLKIKKDVETYSKNIKFGLKNIPLILIIAICALIELFANNFIPFFVIRALGVTNINIWETFVLCIYINYASSFVPTPGGAGIAEISFYAVFDTYFNGGLLFWAILIWRIAYFYMPIIIGFFIQIAESVKIIIKNKYSR